MKRIQSVSLLASFLLTTSVFANEKSLDVIYGEDNRLDVYESRNSALVELSRSTAAMIGTENLKKRNREVVISAGNLQARGVCAKERFSRQISAAGCSGFLVAPKVLVTAGHCIKSEYDCSVNKWVFDYKVEHADQNSITVRAESVYGCKRIISQKLDQVSKDDYAVIELDREVNDRRPLSFRKSGRIGHGTPLAVIGHPSGLPTKIADGAIVRSHSSKLFVANLDTYGGNSGSAVFNTRTMEVEGILVRGENDYVYDSQQGCQVSNYCANNACRGEDVTYITNIPELKRL